MSIFNFFPSSALVIQFELFIVFPLQLNLFQGNTPLQSGLQCLSVEFQSESNLKAKNHNRCKSNCGRVRKQTRKRTTGLGQQDGYLQITLELHHLHETLSHLHSSTSLFSSFLYHAVNHLDLLTLSQRSS